MISRLLVANRGEIARRIFRTCHALGIETVAVFGDPDARSPHVRAADRAVRLGGGYLDVAAIIEAARNAGADAVHPGYGFLSENAAFARAVLDAGLTWVGPPPQAIAAMGSKIEAKEIMKRAGVPVLAGDSYPLLVKASAGGGGRGMRIVRSPCELDGALAAARREAESAFDDPAVFTEPYLGHARHIEVQILADTHGTVWALGERECSIQRRHQKVIEEAPSPGISPELRTALCDAAIAAAKAIDYVGAGTVEFLYAGGDTEGGAPRGSFYFLEMNTRLQVEHPVTEALYNVDLVALQLDIAEGGRLDSAPPSPRGHAIEARLYAEDPAGGYLPQSGTLHRFRVGGDVRVDSGVEDGVTVPPDYDPMLAKVIAHAPSRAAAVRKLIRALEGALIHGLTTNRDQLVRVLRAAEFASGAADTGFLDRHDLTDPLADAAAVRMSGLAAALSDAAAGRRSSPVPGVPAGWRNVPAVPQRRHYRECDVEYRLTRDGLETDLDVRLRAFAPGAVVLEAGGVEMTFTIARYDRLVCVESPLGPVTLHTVPALPEPGDDVAPGSLLSPMPGTVVEVHAAEGDVVAAGQPMFVVEAMKMEHRIDAPHAGRVASVLVKAGQQVEAQAVLAIVPDESE